jgi:hypothetical protein
MRISPQRHREHKVDHEMDTYGREIKTLTRLSLILFVLIRVHSWFSFPLRVLCVSVVNF